MKITRRSLVNMAASAASVVPAPEIFYQASTSAPENPREKRGGAATYERTQAQQMSRLSLKDAPMSIFREGEICVADGLEYRFIAGALDIPDLPNWQPADDVEPSHFGIQATGEDETLEIRAMITWASAHKRTIIWDSRTYIFKDLFHRETEVFVHWRSKGNTILKSSKTKPSTSKPHRNEWEADAFIEFEAETISSMSALSSVYAGDSYLSVPNTNNMAPGRTLIMLSSTRIVESDNRGQRRHGWQTVLSRVVSNTQIELNMPAPTTLEVGNIVGVTIREVNNADNTIVVSGLHTFRRTEVQYKLKLYPDAGRGRPFEVYPHDFDERSQRYVFDHKDSRLIASLKEGDTLDVIRSIDIKVVIGVSLAIGPGISLWREPQIDAQRGDLGYRGLVVSRASSPRVRGLSVTNFSEAGIVFRNCFNPSAKDIIVSGANRAYDEFDGTGYGVVCNQSSWGIFEDITGFSCRRTLDFSGTQGASYHCKTLRIEGHGGGIAYDGVRFWPEGPTENSVVGSHGGGIYTHYSTSRGFNVTSVLNLRGLDEVVRAVFGAGRIQQLINSFKGDGVNADGLYYTDGTPDWVPDGLNVYGYEVGGKLEDAVKIASNSALPTKAHVISNLNLKGVKRGVIAITGTGSLGAISIGGMINLMTDDENQDASEFSIIRHAGKGQATLAAPVSIGALTILDSQSAPKMALFDVNEDGLSIASGVPVKLSPNTVRFRLMRDSAIKIPVFFRRVATFSLIIDHQPGIFDMAAERLVLSPGYARQNVFSLGTVRLNFTDEALSGSTGNEDCVTISFQPTKAEKALYVENRLADTPWSGLMFSIMCDALA